MEYLIPHLTAMLNVVEYLVSWTADPSIFPSRPVDLVSVK